MRPNAISGCEACGLGETPSAQKTLTALLMAAAVVVGALWLFGSDKKKARS